MTDRDVVERVAFLFGRSVQSNSKGRYKTEYGTAIKGRAAADLMRTLRPLMSDRRKAAIDRALGMYSPRRRKLDVGIADSIRTRVEMGDNKAALAREFAVSHHTIRLVVAGQIYAASPTSRWIDLSRRLGGACAAGTGLSWQELHWIAGWLEGEGSFTGPPPSHPVSARITAQAIDDDVVQEVARLLRVKAHYRHSRRARAKGWSPIWSVALRGARAIVLMDAIEPLMGARRSAQIRRARSSTAHSIARVRRERLVP